MHFKVPIFRFFLLLVTEGDIARKVDTIIIWQRIKIPPATVKININCHFDTSWKSPLNLATMLVSILREMSLGRLCLKIGTRMRD